MRMHARGATIAVGSVVALGLVMLGVWVIGTNTGHFSPNVTFVDGYELDSAPAAAVAFAGNEIVVIAQVEAVLPAQWNTANRNQPGSLAFIYTPVRVRVVEVLRGAPQLSGGEMIVRRLGGRVDSDEFVFADDIAPKGLEPGNKLVLFLSGQRDTGDGTVAATPNMAYVIDQAGNARSSNGRWAIDLSALRDMLDN